MTSTEARMKFGEFLDKGSRQTVIVTRQNREVGAFIPMSEYKKLRQLHRKKLSESAAALSAQAKANGLTEEILNEILNEINPS